VPALVQGWCRRAAPQREERARRSSGTQQRLPRKRHPPTQTCQPLALHWVVPLQGCSKALFLERHHLQTRPRSLTVTLRTIRMSLT
jgi:hypothetical protein